MAGCRENVALHRVFIISPPLARHLYRIESLHSPGYPLTAAVDEGTAEKTVVKSLETVCSVNFSLKTYGVIFRNVFLLDYTRFKFMFWSCGLCYRVVRRVTSTLYTELYTVILPASLGKRGTDRTDSAGDTSDLYSGGAWVHISAATPSIYVDIFSIFPQSFLEKCGRPP
jgi:hypothetical protein